MLFFKRLLASLIFFTRLPLKRLSRKVPLECYGDIVSFWPFAGWITGTLWAMVYLCCSNVMSPYAAAFIALLCRTVFTGALHEDGLADFFDAFGVRHSKERTLEIMKDSHIGTFGVISLIFYYGSVVCLVTSVPPIVGAAIFFAADAWSKFMAGRMIGLLPYARPTGDAKNKTVYRKSGVLTATFSFLSGIVPMAIVVIIWPMFIIPFAVAIFASVITFTLTTVMLKKRIDGYTGDCCGAVDLILEFIYLLASVAAINAL